MKFSCCAWHLIQVDLFWPFVWILVSSKNSLLRTRIRNHCYCYIICAYKILVCQWLIFVLYNNICNYPAMIFLQIPWLHISMLHTLTPVPKKTACHPQEATPFQGLGQVTLSPFRLKHLAVGHRRIVVWLTASGGMRYQRYEDEKMASSTLSLKLAA